MAAGEDSGDEEDEEGEERREEREDEDAEGPNDSPVSLYARLQAFLF